MLIKAASITFVILLILCSSLKSNAQDFNINILPFRVAYDSDKKPLSDKDYGLRLLILFKYLEIERKINNKFSLNLGVYYSHKKDRQSLGSYRYLYYNLDPSIRYYFNKKNNMSGFYLSSGISYNRSSSLNSGRFASIDGSIKENNFYYDAINFNLSTGYKVAVIKNRFSIDFKINEIINIFAKEEIITIDTQNSIEIINNHNYQNNIYKPYLDLKLGYRFDFKK
ncbi:MAG: hypothetical protein H7263_16215 [Candidatus Sericytochromatia bacterium]|nr:hypothetical protein [Candidatus Sericytochromatia bacterium]